MIISWPAQFQSNLVSQALVELIDLVPTLYEAVGEQAPNHVQGRSLKPILTGQAPRDEHRDFVRCEFYGAIDFPDQTHVTMYRDRRWKLICYHGKDLYELYDLENDPWEHQDLSQDPNFQYIKWQLLSKSFDATVRGRPPGRGAPCLIRRE